MYEKYRKLLEESHKTSYQVSKDTGISQTAFSNWKSGACKPNLESLIKLAKYFGVSVDYFLATEEDGVNYYDNITGAHVGDTIYYKVLAKNLGSVATTKIVLKDLLPTGVIATSDAIFKDAATDGQTKTEALSSDFFTSTGAKSYQLSVGGEGWYIEYSAKVTEEALAGATSGEAKLVNTVYMDYALEDGGYGSLGDQAAVFVSGF